MLRTKLVAIVALSLLISKAGFGQENSNEFDNSKAKVYGGSGGFHLGFKSYNTASYDYFLPGGTAGFSDNLVTVGGGGYGIYGNWILGGYGFYRGGDVKSVTMGGPLNDAQNFDYSIGGGGGYLTVGYSVFHTNKLLFFPQVGIGLEALSVQKALDEDIATDADLLLSSEYTWASPMLDIGVGIDFFPVEDAGLKLGLRAGYQISTERNNNDWTHQGGRLTNNDLPENDLDGFYLRLVIGGGDFAIK